MVRVCSLWSVGCDHGSICRWGCWGLTPALVSVTPDSGLGNPNPLGSGRILTPALLLLYTAEGVLLIVFPRLMVPLCHLFSHERPQSLTAVILSAVKIE